MRFPTSYNELNKIFLNARDPEIDEMHGEFIVDMLSMLPSFKRFNHRKYIYVRENKLIGHNMLFGKKWGWFSVNESRCRETGFYRTVRLNYDLEDNFMPVKNITDYLRCIEENSLYIGKFYYRLFERSILIGYFTLKKIQ